MGYQRKRLAEAFPLGLTILESIKIGMRRAEQKVIARVGITCTKTIVLSAARFPVREVSPIHMPNQIRAATWVRTTAALAAVSNAAASSLRTPSLGDAEEALPVVLPVEGVGGKLTFNRRVEVITTPPLFVATVDAAAELIAVFICPQALSCSRWAM